VNDGAVNCRITARAHAPRLQQRRALNSWEGTGSCIFRLTAAYIAELVLERTKDFYFEFPY